MAKIRYFSDDEIRKFFDAVRKEKNVRDLLFFRLMYRYGLRLNEAVTIRLADVKPDIQHPLEIHIRRLKGGQDRHYPINPDDAKLLRRWLRKHETFDNRHWQSLHVHNQEKYDLAHDRRFGEEVAQEIL